MKFFGFTKNKEEKKKNKVLQKAQKYARKGQIQKAVSEWESLLKNKNDDANIYNTIGDLYLKGKRKEDAIEAYRKASTLYWDSGFSLKAIAINKKILKIDPRNLDALNCMARLHRERGMISNAKECYLTIASYHLKSGSHDQALEAYQNIVDMDPKNLKVKMGLAELYLKEGMAQEASQVYGEVIGTLLDQSRIDDAEKLCRSLEESRLDPENILVYMARIHLVRGRISEASACLDKLEESSEENPEIYVLKAEVLIRQGKTREGMALLRSMERSRITEHSHLTVFQVLLDAGEFDEAIGFSNELFDRFSESGRFEELLGMYRKVLEHDPGNLSAHQKIVGLLTKLNRSREVVGHYRDMGRIYADAGRIEEARNVYEKLLELDPDDQEVRNRLRELQEKPARSSGMESGEVLLETGEKAEPAGADSDSSGFQEDGMVIETFEPSAMEEEAESSVITQDGEVLLSEQDTSPSSAVEEGTHRETWITDNLTEADVYIKYGHFDRALSNLRKNLEADPKNIPTHDRLLKIYVEQGKIEEQVQTLMTLAGLYREKGNASQFEDALNEVLTLDPGNREARALLEEGGRALSSSAFGEVPLENDSLNFEFEQESLRPEEAGSVPDAKDQEGTGHEVIPEGSVDEWIEEGNFYLQHGMVEEARAVYEKILASFPDRQDIAEQLRKIRDDVSVESGQEEESIEVVSVGGEESPDPGSAFSEPVFPEAEMSFEETPAATDPAQGTPSADFVDFAAELREEIDTTFAETAPADDGTPSGNGKDPSDFGAEIRREVEDSIAFDEHTFGENDVMDIFNEFRRGVQRELGDEDHETHYNLGIAYLEMGLIDEASEEFSIASQDPQRLMDCITMIGLCCIQKGDYEKALNELERGLAIKGRTDEEYIGLRYEIAKVYEHLGDTEKAVQELLAIHEINAGYRDVARKLESLGVTRLRQTDSVGTTLPGKRDKVSYL